MDHGGLGGPSHDHDGGRLVGLDQFHDDRFGGGDPAWGQLGNVWLIDLGHHSFGVCGCVCKLPDTAKHQGYAQSW
jgi:hypothetical protein